MEKYHEPHAETSAIHLKNQSAETPSQRQQRNTESEGLDKREDHLV